MTPPTRQTLAAPGLYLIVRLREELYALPALNVRELIRVPDVTPLPGAPPELRGVVNLRGRILPLFDLASCLQLKPTDIGEYSVIVVVQHELAGSLGFLVDEVVETRQIKVDQIESVTIPGKSPELDFAPCAANLSGKVVFLVSLERVLGVHAPNLGQNAMGSP